jgi:two-component system, OmpR family, KDP operon response regulator KdpE
VSVVLLVEDDVPLRWILRAGLTASDFELLEARSGEEALSVVANAQPDVIVLDLGLPGIDGLETLRRLRSVSRIPVVVLTVRDGLADKIDALDSGADDYVVKPFEMDELAARVRANLRRVTGPAPPPALIRAGDLEVDLGQRRVTWADEPVQLTRIEMRLLEMLVANRGRLLTHAELLDGVWGSRPRGGGLERLRVTVVHLRRKLRDDAAHPRLIFTEPGLGYRWIAHQEEEELDAPDLRA